MSTLIKRAGLLSDLLCPYRALQPLFIVGSEAAGVVSRMGAAGFQRLWGLSLAKGYCGRGFLLVPSLSVPSVP